MSYESLSPIGKAVCEFIELTWRLRYLESWSKVFPTLEIPQTLKDEIEQRYLELDEHAKEPTKCFIADDILHRRPWQEWEIQHFEKFPGDRTGIANMTKIFSEPNLTHILPWEMEHKI